MFVDLSQFGNETRRLLDNALLSKLFIILKKLSSEYQLYTCGNFFECLDFEKIVILGQPPMQGSANPKAPGKL